jgi:hypothetical protein
MKTQNYNKSEFLKDEKPHTGLFRLILNKKRRHTRRLFRRCSFMSLFPVHGDQKFFIGIGFYKPVAQELHRFYGIHIGKVFPEDPDLVQEILIQQKVFPARAGSRNINGRIDTPVGQFAVELQFHVAGSLEFLKDHVIHL